MDDTYPHPVPSHATLHTAGARPPGSPLSSFHPPTAPPCPQPNTVTDHHLSSPSSHHQRVATVGSRSSSLPFHLQMGLSHSKQQPPAPPSATPQPTAKGITATVASGINLKRAFARRRKPSEDSSKLFVAAAKNKEGHDAKLKAGASSPSLSTHAAPKPAPPPLSNVQHSTPARIETTRHDAVKPLSPSYPQSLARSPVPPSSPSMPPAPPKKDVSLPPPRVEPEAPSAGSRVSVMTTDGEISSAVTYLSMMDQHKVASDGEKEGPASPDKREEKENWRKSDSTNSHHTIRPAMHVTSRSSRPVSWAESFQSTHTVMQSSNKRRSALIDDADFGMPEEEDEDIPVSSHGAVSSPSASTHSLHRRSVSLNVASPSSLRLPTPVHDMKFPSLSVSEGLPSFHPTPAPRAPVISPSTSQPQSSASSSNLRGRFAAWTAATGNTNLSVPPVADVSQGRNQSPLSSHAPHSSTSPSSFRQTAISISAGVGPAAVGIARRAVDKIGRKWAQGIGISTSSSAAGGGWSSSASGSDAPGSSHIGEALVRTASNLSLNTSSMPFFHSSPGRGGHKRTPNTASGAGSISSNSMTSGSDSDFFAHPTGPMLGERLRGAMRSKNGTQVIAGVVFGRNLVSAVRETGTRVGKPPGQGGRKRHGLVGQVEERMLPAVVVRCAQHLLLWGVQEEGLFRVNGRPAHVSKLRSEFDSGADYDMAECSPGDLDPHAVASVFKAYLRELPEPILTQKLQPLFDVAINKEAEKNASEPTSTARLGARGAQGLPSGPKSGFTAGLRKPPSLSTLAMPSFTGIPPASKALINTVRALVRQLPLENRDLLLTIVDLIRETAKNSKETKMPLSNLLVVFCPSLNMTPPLLKTLCEVEDIWNGDVPVAAPAEVVIDICKQPVLKGGERDDDSSSEMRSRMDEESNSIASSRPSIDNPSSDYHGSGEGSIYEGRAIPRVLRADFERSEVPTVYLDTRSHISSASSVSSLVHQNTPATGYDVSSSRHRHHDLSSDNGSISSSGAYSIHSGQLSSSSPPPLSSSAESIITPTSSGNPSFADLQLTVGHDDDRQHAHALGLQHEHHNGSGQLIIDAAALEMHMQANKRPYISKPIPISTERFPGDSPLQTPAPHTPASPTSKRRSIPMLSLPILAPITPMYQTPQPSPRSPAHAHAFSEQQQQQQQRTLRAKKPSLKLLFSKRSVASLNGLKDRNAFISAPILQGARPSPKSESDGSSSVSTPLSAVTAPLGADQDVDQGSESGSARLSGRRSAASSVMFPPVLDTPIEDSQLRMDLGFDMSPPPTATPTDGQADSTWRPRSPPFSLEEEKERAVERSPYGRSQGYASNSDTDPFNVNLSARRTIKPGENHIRMRAQPSASSSSSNLSILSTASSHHLSLFEDDDEHVGAEEWTQSVLLAADVDGGWIVQKPKVKS